MKVEKLSDIITVISANRGKVFRRKSDKMVFGNQLNLGYTHYLNEQKLDVPLLELPEHYEEIDEPVTDETIILDEQTQLVEELPDAEHEEPVQTPQKVTLADYRELEKTVKKLKEKLGI